VTRPKVCHAACAGAADSQNSAIAAQHVPCFKRIAAPDRVKLREA
jgi:hypothetical protein